MSLTALSREFLQSCYLRYHPRWSYIGWIMIENINVAIDPCGMGRGGRLCNFPSVSRGPLNNAFMHPAVLEGLKPYAGVSTTVCTRPCVSYQEHDVSTMFCSKCRAGGTKNIKGSMGV